MLYFSNYCNILMKVGELMFYKENTDHEITRSEGGGLMPQMHEHSYYELYYLEAGSREYFVEDTIFSVEAGDFVLIAPGKLHRTGGEYGMRVLVCFTEDFILRTFTRSAAQRLLACFDDLKLTPGKHRRELFISLLQRIESAADETEFALQLGALLQELNRCEKAEVSGEPVSAIVAYINANFASIQNIGQIAERYRDTIPSMEVTNETVHRHSNPTKFFEEPNMVEWSFARARAHLPTTKLIINEATQYIWKNTFKYNRSIYYMQIERALLKGASIDSIGMQFHMFWPQDQEAVEVKAVWPRFYGW